MGTGSVCYQDLALVDGCDTDPGGFPNQSLAYAPESDRVSAFPASNVTRVAHHVDVEEAGRSEWFSHTLSTPFAIRSVACAMVSPSRISIWYGSWNGFLLPAVNVLNPSHRKPIDSAITPTRS